MGKKSTNNIIKEIFDKTNKSYTTDEMTQLLDERYAMSISSKHVSWLMIQLVRSGFLTRERVTNDKGKKGRNYRYKKR